MNRKTVNYFKIVLILMFILTMVKGQPLIYESEMKSDCIGSGCAITRQLVQKCPHICEKLDRKGVCRMDVNCLELLVVYGNFLKNYIILFFSY